MRTPRTNKHRAAALLARSQLLRFPERLRGRRGYLTILAYHRVLDIDPERYPYDEDVVSATPEAFDEQMAYVRANFDVVTFSELDLALAERRVPARPLIISFDDGYRDNYLEALPILHRHGLRAVVYLATGYVGGTDTFWHEKLVYWLKASNRPHIRFGAAGEKLPLGAQRSATLRRVLTALKLVDERAHARLMAQIEEQVGCGLERRDLVAFVSWDEVREMHASGIECGAHSVSHYNLAAISPECLHRELADSRAAIETQTGAAVVSLAYPFGGHEHHSEAVRMAAQTAGYQFGLSYVEGINPLAALDRYGLRRIHVEQDVDMDLFRSLLQWPVLFARD